MGKRIISQRRGRGTSTYRASSHKNKGKAVHKKISKKEVVFGKVVDLVHCPGHSAPLVKIKYEDGDEGLMVATEGISVGSTVSAGSSSVVEKGNALPLANIPIGSFVCNLEASPGDGGKFVRSSGGFAKVVAKSENMVTVLMPSKKKKSFNILCMALIGVVAGGGRLEKPWLKAGKKHHAMRARGKLYPRTSGVAMNPIDHPFGSGRGRHPGKSTVAPRHAPPGRKVGKFGARRTGKKK